MADSTRIALRLDLDPAADPIRGRLTAPTGEEDEFVGWLGLAGAIERLARVDVQAAWPRLWTDVQL
jgi:hypothetical protein